MTFFFCVSKNKALNNQTYCISQKGQNIKSSISGGILGHFEKCLDSKNTSYDVTTSDYDVIIKNRLVSKKSTDDVIYPLRRGPTQQKKIAFFLSSFFLQRSSELKMENPTQNKVKYIRQLLSEHIVNVIVNLSVLPNVTMIPSILKSMRKKTREESENSFTPVPENELSSF